MDELIKMLDEKIKCIQSVFDDKLKIRFRKNGVHGQRDFIVDSINYKDMKIGATRVFADDSTKEGFLLIDSYDIEELYKLLPKKYKTVKEEQKPVKQIKKKEQNKMEDQNTSAEENTAPAPKPEVKKTVAVSKLIKDFVKENSGCSFEQIEQLYKDNGRILAWDLKKYILTLGIKLTDGKYSF